jgi:hypothetical protein
MAVVSLKIKLTRASEAAITTPMHGVPRSVRAR